MAAADGVAGDHRDDRLGQVADLALQVEHVEARHAVVADVAAVAAHALVAAGAEGLVARAGEDDDADARRPRAPRSKASVSSNSVSGRKALRTSGRLIVILAMPSAYSIENVAVVVDRFPLYGCHGDNSPLLDHTKIVVLQQKIAAPARCKDAGLLQVDRVAGAVERAQGGVAAGARGHLLGQARELGVERARPAAASGRRDRPARPRATAARRCPGRAGCSPARRVSCAGAGRAGRRARPRGKRGLAGPQRQRLPAIHEGRDAVALDPLGQRGIGGHAGRALLGDRQARRRALQHQRADPLRVAASASAAPPARPSNSRADAPGRARRQLRRAAAADRPRVALHARSARDRRARRMRRGRADRRRCVVKRRPRRRSTCGAQPAALPVKPCSSTSRRPLRRHQRAACRAARRGSAYR